MAPTTVESLPVVNQNQTPMRDLMREQTRAIVDSVDAGNELVLESLQGLHDTFGRIAMTTDSIMGTIVRSYELGMRQLQVMMEQAMISRDVLVRERRRDHLENFRDREAAAERGRLPVPTQPRETNVRGAPVLGNLSPLMAAGLGGIGRMFSFFGLFGKLVPIGLIAGATAVLTRGVFGRLFSFFGAIGKALPLGALRGATGLLAGLTIKPLLSLIGRFARLFGPIGLVVTALTLIEREDIDRFIAFVTDKLFPAIRDVFAKLEPALKPLGELMTTIVNVLIDDVLPVLGTGLLFGIRQLGNLVGIVSRGVGGVVTFINDDLVTGISSLREMFGDVVTGIQSILDGNFLMDIRSHVSTAIARVMGIFDLGSVTDGIMNVTNGIRSFVMTAVSRVMGIFDIGSVTDGIMNVTDGIRSFVMNGIMKIMNVFDIGSVTDGIANVTSDIRSFVMTAVSRVMNVFDMGSVTDGIANVTGFIRSFVMDGIARIKSLFMIDTNVVGANLMNVGDMLRDSLLMGSRLVGFLFGINGEMITEGMTDLTTRVRTEIGRAMGFVDSVLTFDGNNPILRGIGDIASIVRDSAMDAVRFFEELLPSREDLERFALRTIASISGDRDRIDSIAERFLVNRLGYDRDEADRIIERPTTDGTVPPAARPVMRPVPENTGVDMTRRHAEMTVVRERQTRATSLINAPTIAPVDASSTNISHQRVNIHTGGGSLNNEPSVRNYSDALYTSP